MNFYLCFRGSESCLSHATKILLSCVCLSYPEKRPTFKLQQQYFPSLNKIYLNKVSSIWKENTFCFSFEYHYGFMTFYSLLKISVILISSLKQNLSFLTCVDSLNWLPCPLNVLKSTLASWKIPGSSLKIFSN